jgi:hypothetical protein
MVVLDLGIIVFRITVHSKATDITAIVTVLLERISRLRLVVDGLSIEHIGLHPKANTI